jgi:hypothetical protein
MGTRIGRVKAAVLGFLLETPAAVRQTAIAAMVGATQARVSQILAETGHAGLTERAEGGWRVRDPGRMFDLCVHARPVVGADEAWYGLEPTGRQVEQYAELARRDDVEYRLGGDWAADRLAPWRIPTIAVLHANRSVDLEHLGFVPAALGEATLLVHLDSDRPRWSCDPRVAAEMAGERPGIPLSPVHEIAREILAAGGPDATEAVAELRTRFLDARSTVVGR